MTEWFDDETFWVDLYDFLFTEKRMAAAEEEVESLLSLVPYQGTAVLDLCCGPGRHALALARRGLNVTGVDRTAFLLDKARLAARSEELEVEWVLSDMRDFVRTDAFDLVLNMFTSFGYFVDKADDLRVLNNIHASLKPGGWVLIEGAGKEWLADRFQATSSEQAADGTLLVQRHEIVDDWSRIRNEWILIRDGSARTFRFQHTIYSGQELKDRLLESGFSRVRLHGDFQGNEYGPGAKRLIAVAMKE